MNINNLDHYYEGGSKLAESGSSIRNVPLSSTLKEKLKYHHDQVIKIEATLELLESNKDIEKLLFLLSEVH